MAANSKIHNRQKSTVKEKRYTKIHSYMANYFIASTQSSFSTITIFIIHKASDDDDNFRILLNRPIFPRLLQQAW